MRSPFKKPEIDYVPQIAQATEPAALPVGDDGYKVSSNTVLDAVTSLQGEAKVAISVIEAGLSSFAVTDRSGSMAEVAKSVLNTESKPSSISYDTYVSLGVYPGGESVRAAFEDKAFSVWGNASLAIVSALNTIIAECDRIIALLTSGVEDELILEQIGEWAGRARMLVVDFTSIGTASPKTVAEEASLYADQAVEVQKSAISSSKAMKDAILRDLSRLARSMSSDEAYATYLDTPPSINDVGGAIVPVLAQKQARIAERTRIDRVNDISYRIEAFNEAATSLMASISELKAVQLLNGELSRSGGISEISIEEIVTTTPDISFDINARTKIAEEQGLNADDPASVQIFRNKILAEAEALIPEEDLTWHTLSEHETLGLISEADADSAYADISHNHDLDYSDIGHDHDSVYVNETDHTKSAHDALGINADLLDGSHLAEIVEAVKLAIWPVGSIYTSMNSTSPATLFGGTWVAMPGRVLVGAGTITDARGETKTFNAGDTGGEIQHVLTVAEIPSHSHPDVQVTEWGGYGQNSAINGLAVQTQAAVTGGATGGGGAHNNLQPYEVVYMWKRTA